MSEILVNDGTSINDHLTIIHKIAWNLHNVSGYDTEDLYSEGCLSYLLNRDKFDSSKNVRFSTFLWTQVTNSLRDYLRKQPRVIFVEPDSTIENSTENFLGTNHVKHRVTEKFLYNAY